MNIPEKLSYSKTHEWVLISGDTARIGMTDYAQDAMGSLVFVNLPEVGDDVAAGESFGDVESVKTVSDVNSPVSGKVSAVNEELLDAPEKINEAPYDAWMIEVTGLGKRDGLMDAAAYAAFVEAEG
jgi:glycine cleavage system H protein